MSQSTEEAETADSFLGSLETEDRAGIKEMEGRRASHEHLLAFPPFLRWEILIMFVNRTGGEGWVGGPTDRTE